MATSTYTVTIKQTGTEAGTNRPIYTVDTLDGEHVCDTLSWFDLGKAREHAAEMSQRYLDAPITDETTQQHKTRDYGFELERVWGTSSSSYYVINSETKERVSKRFTSRAKAVVYCHELNTDWLLKRQAEQAAEAKARETGATITSLLVLTDKGQVTYATMQTMRLLTTGQIMVTSYHYLPPCSLPNSRGLWLSDTPSQGITKAMLDDMAVMFHKAGY